MKHLSLFLIAIVWLASACREPTKQEENQTQTKEITVSAAASLQNAFREIGALYEKQTGVKVNFNFASSGALQKQIEQGAPVDVFASAGLQQMSALSDKKLLADDGYWINFARNELVMIVSSSADFKSADFVKLLENETVKIAIGNPKTVPAGVYAEQTLRHFGVWEKVQPRLILTEDVRQVLEYVSRGETEAGIVYASDLSVANKKVREAARAPENSHERIFYPIAVLKSSRNQDAAFDFLKFVIRDEGQQVLSKNGFMRVE